MNRTNLEERVGHARVGLGARVLNGAFGDGIRRLGVGNGNGELLADEERLAEGAAKRDGALRERRAVAERVLLGDLPNGAARANLATNRAVVVDDLAGAVKIYA